MTGLGGALGAAHWTRPYIVAQWRRCHGMVYDIAAQWKRRHGPFIA